MNIMSRSRDLTDGVKGHHHYHLHQYQQQTQHNYRHVHRTLLLLIISTLLSTISALDIDNLQRAQGGKLVSDKNIDVVSRCKQNCPQQLVSLHFSSSFDWSSGVECLVGLVRGHLSVEERPPVDSHWGQMEC